MIMRRIFIFLTISTLAVVAMASEEASHKEAYQLLEYQYWHPQEHLVYLKLGNLYELFYPAEHPIRDYHELQTDLYNIKLFYGNCLHYAKDQNLKQDEYLQIPHAGKRTTYEELDKELRKRIDSAKEKQRLSSELYEAYYKLYAHYDLCRTLYTEFAETYPREKNAHLLLDDAHLLLLNNLSKLTDSVRMDIQNYEKALRAYPIDGYSPVFRWENIALYRIDGLTKTEFLQNDIALWNYQDWVNHFLAEHNSLYRDYYLDIRKELTEYKSDERLLNTIARLDYGSFMQTWFAIRQGARQVEEASRKDILMASSDDYLETVLPYVRLQKEHVKTLYEQKTQLLRQVSDSEFSKYQSALETSGYGSCAKIVEDASAQLDKADVWYDAICHSVVEHANLSVSPFELYTNDFTGEKITLDVLSKLGITNEGKVIAVIPVGYSYMAVLDSYKTIMFDTERVYGAYQSFEVAIKKGTHLTNTVLTSYKMSSNTIAIILDSTILFVDNQGILK